MLVTAWPATQVGLSASPGMSGMNFAPEGASGVICCPVLGIVCELPERTEALKASATAEIRKSLDISSPPQTFVRLIASPLDWYCSSDRSLTRAVLYR